MKKCRRKSLGLLQCLDFSSVLAAPKSGLIIIMQISVTAGGSTGCLPSAEKKEEKICWQSRNGK